MNAIESILVVLDRSDRDQHVCDKALSLARLFNARLELFLCDAERELALKQNFDARSASEGRNACIVEAVRYLSSARASLPLDTARVVTSAWCDSPLSEGICRKVAQAKPDLVLKSPDCAHSGQRLAFSDNDWHLASTCPAPVMFVRGRTWSSAPRIGAAVDISSSQALPLAREILGVASQLQSRSQGHLEISTCVAQSPPGTPRTLRSGRLDEALSGVTLPKEDVHLLDGDADNVIPRFAAERRYDVLVMGALAHRSGVAPVVGSLTSKLIEALDCDFVLVKVDAAMAQEWPA